MSKHTANWPVDYNGKRYEKSEPITFKDDEASQAQAQRLIDAGAITPAIEDKNAKAPAK